MSYIYHDLSEAVAAQCGYFEPKSFSPIFHGFSEVVKVGSPSPMDKDTLILYFPGSFGTFHQGHAECVRNAVMDAMRITRNVAVVISPANSDYTAEKYGAWSVNSSNKYRFEQIKRFVPCPLYIDLVPMMNYTSDQNFTDLIDEFVKRNLDMTVGALTHAPWILCGKDRSSFMQLNDYTNKVKVHFTKGSTDQSTSANLGGMRTKKELILRCETHEEYELFSEYFHDQYTHIEPSFLDVERSVAESYAKYNDIKHTICFDYREFLTYHPVSRMWDNPFEQSKDFLVYPTLTNLPRNTRILDSDIFTGSTRTKMNDLGYNLFTVMDATNRLNVEIVDISDLRDDWCYPFVDISSRASMQTFTHEFHERYNNFVKELKAI